MKKQIMTIATTAGLLFTAFGGSASAHGTTYTVHSGDCLSKIAKVNHVTVNQLKEWNHLKSDLIKKNQTLLLVPLKSSNTATPSKASSSVKVKALSISPAPVSISKVQAVISEAKKYIGTPYKWGGITPSGFDCSGYVNYVFKKVGVSLPRTTSAIWSSTKSVGSPKPGDFVFFKTVSNSPSHIGIYLGGNQFIHASSHGVMISNITLSYWKTRFIGARTIF